MNCFSSLDCFASIGLKRKQYCILNKQYSKEEYEDLKAKIIQHMDSMPYVDRRGSKEITYKYGEFFPIDMAPYAVNETVIMNFTDLTKEKAIEYGLTWREPEAFEYKTTLRAEDLPDHIKDVSDNITKEIIGCADCKKAYRIILKELEFYKRFQIPLPRMCHNCRYLKRMKFKNIPKWFERECQCAGETSSNKIYTNTSKHFHETDRCPNKFITAYDPEMSGIIYCEKCYNSETF